MSTIARKSLLGRVTPIQYETVSGCFHALFSIGLLLFTKSNMKNIDAESWTLIIAQSLMSMAAIFSFMYALKGSTNLGASSAIVSAAPIVTMILSMIFYGERPELRSVVGILLILVGTFIVTTR